MSVRKTYVIELKIQFDNDEIDTILKEMARDYAEQLYTAAKLVMEAHEPEIAVYGNHYFEGKSEIVRYGSNEDAGS